jgi:hypothetical protein
VKPRQTPTAPFGTLSKGSAVHIVESNIDISAVFVEQLQSDADDQTDVNANYTLLLSQINIGIQSPYHEPNHQQH